MFALLEDLTVDLPRKAWPSDDRPIVIREGNSVGLKTKEVSTWISPFNGLVHIFSDDQTVEDWGFTTYGTRAFKQLIKGEVRKKKKLTPEKIAIEKHGPVLFSTFITFSGKLTF